MVPMRAKSGLDASHEGFSSKAMGDSGFVAGFFHFRLRQRKFARRHIVCASRD